MAKISTIWWLGCALGTVGLILMNDGSFGEALFFIGLACLGFAAGGFIKELKENV